MGRDEAVLSIHAGAGDVARDEEALSIRDEAAYVRDVLRL